MSADYATVLKGLGFGISAVFVTRHMQWRQSLSTVDVSIESPVGFISKEGFRALKAVVDTFIPALKDLTELDVLSELQDKSKFAAFNGDADAELFDTGFLSGKDKLSLEKMNHMSRGGVLSDTHTLCAKALQGFLTPDVKTKLNQFLSALENPVTNFLITGFLASFSTLTLSDRVIALTRMRDAMIPDIRGGYLGIKRVVGNLFLAYSHRKEQNPSWGALRYSLRDTQKDFVPTEDKIKSRSIFLDSSDRGKFNNDKSKLLELDGSIFDVIVVGSGSGGGVISSELVKQGYNVLVLEKGGHFESSDFKEWSETEAFGRAYDNGGLLTSSDGNIVVLAGSCVGGGSTVNWNASLRTPRHVTDEWAKQGLPQFQEGGSFDKSLDKVHELLNVNTKFSYRRNCSSGAGGDCSSMRGNQDEPDPNFVVNSNNHTLVNAAANLNYPTSAIPRNTKNCVDCGNCPHGCAYDSKRSSYTACMKPLLLAEEEKITSSTGRLRIVPNCHVDRLIIKDYRSSNGDAKQATDGYSSVVDGVELTISLYADTDIGPDREQPISKISMKVHSKVVIAACGSIQTPALLLRSGLKNDMIGRNLTLHPVAGCGGYSKDLSSAGQGADEDNLNLSRGVGMGVAVYPPNLYPLSMKEDNKKNLNDSSRDANYGVLIQTPPLHPGMLGLILPWSSGLLFKLSMLWYPRLSAFIGIARDKSSHNNRVVVDSLGNPVIHYSLTQEDKKLVMDGLKEQIKLMYNAGVNALFPIHEHFPWFIVKNNKSKSENDNDLERYLKAVEKEGIEPFKLQIFSAHQMSSCRMAASPKLGPVRPTGELWECKGLFVADGSALPTSLGVNPMITIAAFALNIAENVAKSLKQGK